MPLHPREFFTAENFPHGFLCVCAECVAKANSPDCPREATWEREPIWSTDGRIGGGGTMETEMKPHPLTFGQSQKKYSEELKFRRLDVEWSTDGPGVIAPEKLSAFVRVCATEYANAMDVLKCAGLA